MDRFNQTQKSLVELSERAHFEGIRHAGLSGAICEDLLIEVLRKDLPRFNFSRGVIKFADGLSTGSSLSGSRDLSSQIDIVIFQGKPLFRAKGGVVVHQSQVLGVIEVKKWLYPAALFRAQSVISRLREIASSLETKCARPIPVFLAAFRFHDRQFDSVSWLSLTRGFPVERVYCFYGGLSRRDNRNLYPWEEERWADFEIGPYAGQYGKLVKDIKKLK